MTSDKSVRNVGAKLRPAKVPLSTYTNLLGPHARLASKRFVVLKALHHELDALGRERAGIVPLVVLDHLLCVFLHLGFGSLGQLDLAAIGGDLAENLFPRAMRGVD